MRTDSLARQIDAGHRHHLIGGTAWAFGFSIGGAIVSTGLIAGNGGLTVLDDIANVPTFDLPAPFQNLPVQGPYTQGDPIGYDQTVTVTDVHELPVYPVDGGHNA